MATVKAYVTAMRRAQNTVAASMGVDLSRASQETRVALLVSEALLGVVCKTLVDAGVITDVQLTARLNAALAAVDYDAEPPQPPPL